MIKKSFGAHITSAGTTTLYTVPTGKKTEYRAAYITNTAGSNGTVTMVIGGLNFLSGYTISSKEILHLGGRENDFIVLKAGDTITGTSTQDMTMIVSLIEYADLVQGG
jgi:hypothetical protein